MLQAKLGNDNLLSKISPLDLGEASY